MGKQIEALAEFAARTRWEDIPESVQRHAKRVLLDTLGVILAGSTRPEVERLRERIAPNAGSGATVYARRFAIHDIRTAALLNGIAGRAIELCEGLRLVSGQAGVQILPALLALGEAGDSSGRDILTGLVLGYDIAGRLGVAFKPRPLAHQNGQVSMIGAAAACARLRGFDANGVSLAMRIATTLVLTPSYTNAVAGATALNVAGGMSSFVGALAPDLALSGFEAQGDAIEESLSQLVGEGFDASALVDELGTRWEITRNYFRLYACCNPVHGALDALATLLKKLAPRPDDVERIDIATYRFASVMRIAHPPNYFASKYSLPHAAATMVVKGGAGYHALDDASLDDPAIASLRKRVHITEDSAMSAVAPKLRPARVTITLKNGSSATESRQSHRGDFNEPFDDAELRDKFRELAGEVLTAEGTERLEAQIGRFDETGRVREFVEVMRAYARA